MGFSTHHYPVTLPKTVESDISHVRISPHISIRSILDYWNIGILDSRSPFGTDTSATLENVHDISSVSGNVPSFLSSGLPSILLATKPDVDIEVSTNSFDMSSLPSSTNTTPTTKLKTVFPSSATPTPNITEETPPLGGESSLLLATKSTRANVPDFLKVGIKSENLFNKSVIITIYRII